MSNGTLRELVSPVSHLISSEESLSATRGHAITVLALIAYRLDDRTLPPTIYNTIRKANIEKEFGFHIDAESTLIGMLVLAEAEFEIPEDVRDWVSSFLDSSQDVESHDYETIGELAVRIVGAIGDAEAHRTLDKLAVDSNYPIRTRQTAQEMLEGYEREE
jgi:hypothetical protein